MKAPPVPLRVLSVPVLVLAAVLGAAAAQEAVDFSQAPAPGLKYKVVSSTNSETKRSMTVGERELAMKTTGEREATFVDTILAVKEGKIVKMEREYEDVSSKAVTESDQLEEPREREQDSPLAWKHFRAEWNEDGDVTVKVKDDDAWGDVDDRLKRQLRPKRLRRPLFPLPRGPKTVGESWELSDENVKTYFPPRRPRRRSGEEAPPIPQTVSGKLTLVEITDHQELRCAVLKAALEMRQHDQSRADLLL
jgi:hypothetical protein